MTTYAGQKANGRTSNHRRIREFETNLHTDSRQIGDGKILSLKGTKASALTHIPVDGYEVDEEELVVGLNGIVRPKEEKIMR